MSNKGSLARQNYHEECEAKVNMQVNMHMYHSYVLMSMAHYFDRDDVALHGLHGYFKNVSEEEKELADQFLKYQNTRGGRIVLQPVSKPIRDDWGSALDALMTALEMEKTINKMLLDIHRNAGDNNDPQLCDFLESDFLEKKVESIKKLADMITQLKRCGPGIGEHFFDRELVKGN